MKKSFVLVATLALTLLIMPVSSVFAAASTYEELQAACTALGGTLSKTGEGVQNSRKYVEYQCNGYRTTGSSSSDSDRQAMIRNCSAIGRVGEGAGEPAAGVYAWICKSTGGSGKVKILGEKTYGGTNGGTSAPTSSTAPHSCGGVGTAIIQCGSDEDGSAIFEILATALSIFTFGVSAAAVIGIIIAAYQYMSARDNAQIVAKAKNRIVQIVIGLVAWIMIWVILELLLPGGLLGNPS